MLQQIQKSAVKCAKPILSVCTNSNEPRWSGDGDELKVISSSLELLLHWISDEKKSSRYLGKEDTTENDTSFGGNDGHTKLVLCSEIRKYIQDRNRTVREPKPIRQKLVKLVD